jgi:Integral membrane protein TerC family
LLNSVSSLLDWSGIGAVFAQFSSEIHHPQFWISLSKIIWINVLLSGDNALVVAMACRGLAPRQRLWGMVLGSAAAVMLRIIFTRHRRDRDGIALFEAGGRSGAARDRGQAPCARQR